MHTEFIQTLSGYTENSYRPYEGAHRTHAHSIRVTEFMQTISGYTENSYRLSGCAKNSVRVHTELMQILSGSLNSCTLSVCTEFMQTLSGCTKPMQTLSGCTELTHTLSGSQIPCIPKEGMHNSCSNPRPCIRYKGALNSCAPSRNIQDSSRLYHGAQNPCRLYL